MKLISKKVLNRVSPAVLIALGFVKINKYNQGNLDVAIGTWYNFKLDIYYSAKIHTLARLIRNYGEALLCSYNQRINATHYEITRSLLGDPR